jgi:hypothetical protein
LDGSKAQAQQRWGDNAIGLGPVFEAGLADKSRRKDLLSSRARIWEMMMRIRMFAAMLGCLFTQAVHAEEPTANTPALWGSPTIDNGACCKTHEAPRNRIG